MQIEAEDAGWRFMGMNRQSTAVYYAQQYRVSVRTRHFVRATFKRQNLCRAYVL